MKPQDKKILKERIKSFFPQATTSGVEQLMNLLINCCCIDLCAISDADDVQFTAMGLTGNTLSLTLTINGTPITQTVTLPSDINTTITDTVNGHLIANYTNENSVITPINETVTSLGTPTLVNNILTIPFNNEAGNTVSVSVDLSVLSSDIHIQGITYNSVTNTWTITQTDGSTSIITWNDILTDIDFCPAVKSCETVTTLINNGDGTYTYTNEIGTSTIIAVLTTEKLTIGGTLFPIGTNIQTILNALTTLAHVPVTTVDSGSINFIQSGTDNQTITAEINGIATATAGQIPTTDGSGNIVWSTVTPNANNGLNIDGVNVQLGGILVENTSIDNGVYNLVDTVTDPLNNVLTEGNYYDNINFGSGFSVRETKLENATEQAYVNELWFGDGAGAKPTIEWFATNTLTGKYSSMQLKPLSVNLESNNLVQIVVSDVNGTLVINPPNFGTANAGDVLTLMPTGETLWQAANNSVTADNGLSVNSGVVELGGILYKDTLIEDTTNNTNSLLIGTTTPLNSFKVTTETENLVKTSINDYDAYLRTTPNYNKLEVSSLTNPEISRVDTTAIAGQATTNISATDGTETAQTNYKAQSGNTYVQTIVTDGTNTNTLRVTPLTLQSEIHPNFRDDTSVETPINFLYTNGIGEVLSAPVGQGTAGFWALTGNVGTDGGLINFLGTTDTVDLVFKTNNVQITRFGQQGNAAFGSDLTSIAPTLIAPIASNIGSMAFQSGQATGAFSTAFQVSIASGDASVAFGEGNTASGYLSTTFGKNNISNGNYSVVFGENNIVSGTYSVAFGRDNTANGDNSFTFGENNTASGNYSTAFGWNNTSPSDNETTLGLFSTNYTVANNNSDRLFTIGNGKSDILRNNAITLWKDGRSMWNGDVAKQNTWIGVNGTNAQNFINVTTPTGVLAAISTEHTPSGNYAVLGSNGGNSGLVINNTKQFAFTTTAGTTSTSLGATNTIANYGNTGFLFGGGAVAMSTVEVNGTLGLSNTRINTANPILNTNNVVFHFTGGASGTVDLTAHKIDNRVLTLTNYSGVTLTLSDSVRTGSATTTTSLPNNVSIIITYDGTEFFKIN